MNKWKCLLKAKPLPASSPPPQTDPVIQKPAGRGQGKEQMTAWPPTSRTAMSVRSAAHPPNQALLTTGGSPTAWGRPPESLQWGGGCWEEHKEVHTVTKERRTRSVSPPTTTTTSRPMGARPKGFKRGKKWNRNEMKITDNSYTSTFNFLYCTSENWGLDSSIKYYMRDPRRS